MWIRKNEKTLYVIFAKGVVRILGTLVTIEKKFARGGGQMAVNRLKGVGNHIRRDIQRFDSWGK
jgi:hypothetical protein